MTSGPPKRSDIIWANEQTVNQSMFYFTSVHSDTWPPKQQQKLQYVWVNYITQLLSYPQDYNSYEYEQLI